MNKFLIIIFGVLAVAFPIFERFGNTGWTFTSVPDLFPFFGLLAFSLLWLHAISGVFEPWLRKQIDFNKFVHWTSILILFSILLHPLLLLIAANFDFVLLFGSWNLYIWLGLIGWLLLITYDIGKLIKNNFIARNWNKILIISSIGFILTFFHSINLGSDLASGRLRIVWMFYGITAILAIIYTYGIKRFLKQN